MKKILLTVIITVILALILSVNCFASAPLDEGDYYFDLVELLDDNPDVVSALLDGTLDKDGFVGFVADVTTWNGNNISGVISNAYISTLVDSHGDEVTYLNLYISESYNIIYALDFPDWDFNAQHLSLIHI